MTLNDDGFKDSAENWEIIPDRLFFLHGDITLMETTAIVNAANNSLLGGGGVDGAIHRAGGAAILKECQDIRHHRFPHGLPTGEAVMTSGGKLKAEYVIHTVGPVWEGGGAEEPRLLARAYENCLNLARETGMSSIAFPALSTGVYGYPKDKAAPLVYNLIREYLDRHSLPRQVYLVFFKTEDRALFYQYRGE